MTLAVLFPSTFPDAPLVLRDGKPLVEELGDQLRRAGARDVVVAADLAGVTELASQGDEPLLLCSGDLVAHAAVLRQLATDPTPASVALVLPGVPVSTGHAAIVEDRRQLVGVGTEPDLPGEPDGTFGGAVRIPVGDLPALAVAARRVAAATGATPALDRLVAEFVHTGTTIISHRVRLLVARRVSAQDEIVAAEAAIAAVDPDAACLRLSVKEKDDFFTTYAVSTWSPYVTRLAARIGLGPTGVTTISVLFAFAAAALFAFDGRPALVAGAVLLYLGFVLDCVDGQLARYTRRFSAWGGWLDTMADRAKEYVVYAGLAAGAERAGLGDGWGLAIAAMTLQTVRHMTDTWYGTLHDEAARRPKPAGPAAAAGGLGARLSRASTRVQADTGSVAYWLKRTVVFPIGERWALIALTVALFNPLVSLVAVLTWGTLAFAYTLTLRTVRARSMRVPVLSTVDTTLHRDDGPIARGVHRAFGFRWLPGPLPLALLAVVAGATMLGAALVGSGTANGWTLPTAAVVVLAGAARCAAPHTGASDWLVPAVLRAAEYLFVIAVGTWWRVPAPLILGLLLVLALHHYDLTARLEKRSGPPPAHTATLGWDGRVSGLAIIAAVGLATGGFAVLAGYLLVIFVLGAVRGWTRATLRDRHDAERDIAYAGG